ncbi:PAS domain-containing protein [Hymenobacter puniceus]|uniref:PAS domain-containing protein n=1 Tax=Hymenobacter sp. BT190 TaxID=2763505 RepID=UPI0016512BFB|nr:PAS domain-containing protein [Hymenobacter sp. BT190]MBC6698421.1 PAS domain-containing protein [Hymenobacter sp. BT190]
MPDTLGLLTAVAPSDTLLLDLLAVSLTGVILYTPVYDPGGSGDIVDFTFEYLNPTAQRMMHMPEVPTVTHNQQWPHSIAHGTFQFHVEAYVSGEPREYNVNYQADGYDNYYRLAARRSGAGLLVSFTDTADQPRSPVEVALRESQAAEKMARAEADKQRQRFYDLLMQLPAHVAVHEGPDQIFTLVNPDYQRLAPGRDLLGKPIRAVWPELASHGILDVLDQVYQTGEPFSATEVPVQADFTRTGKLEQVYYNFFFLALRDAEGRINGVLNFSYDVTEQVRARQQVQQLNQELEARILERTAEALAARAEAEAQRGDLQRVFEQAPVSIAIFRGPSFVVELANAEQGLLWGHPVAPVLGRPLFEALPDIAGQGLEEIFTQVLTTGEPYHVEEIPCTIDRATSGRPEQGYFTFTYQPLRDRQGHVTGLMPVGIEVTEQVLARHQAQALQTQLLDAARRQAQQREAFYQVYEQTAAAVALLRGPAHRYEYINPAYQAFFPGRQMVGLDLADAAPELSAQGFAILLDQVYHTGETFFGTELAFTPPPAPGQPARPLYFNFTYQAYREAGTVVGVSIYAYDVTEQVEARRQREAEREQLQRLFMEAPAAICILSGPELVYELVNPSYQALFPDRRLLGRPIVEALPEIADHTVARTFRQVFETGVTHEEAAILIPLARPGDGVLENRYFNYIQQARRDEQGCVDGVLVFAFEVTEQVVARQRAEESREALKRYQFMADQARDALILMRADSSFAYLNARALEVWGYTAEEAAQLRVPDVDVLYQASAFAELFAQAQHESVPQFETLHRRQDGYVYPVEVSVGALQVGEEPYLLAVARDITEQQRTLAALRESEARFRIMADAAPNHVWAVNPDTTIRYVNRAFLDFVGLSQDEYLDAGWSAFMHPEELDAAQRTLEQAIQTGALYELKHRFLRHDGQYRWLLAQGAPSYYPNGELYGYVGSAIDITELTQTNEQLTRINVDLDTFIYTASHDLKAPISNIEGLLQTLQEELPPQSPAGEVAYILHLMQDSVERFKKTIDQLTDVSKLQKEHDQPVGQVALAAVLEDVRQDLAPLLQQTGGHLDVDVQATPTLTFSEKNLRSVVYNLLSNALKFAHPNRTPQVQVRSRTEGAYAVLEVQDNGLGIDLEQGEGKLFVMFQRLHTHVEGTGVGLYMIKRMVENAGGRIAVQSTVGQGSTFTVYFPR